MRARAHLNAVLHWSPDTRAGAADILAAALGMGVPMLLAGWAGHLPLGIAAALGSLAITGVDAHASARVHARALAAALLLAVLAGLTAALTSGHGTASEAMVIAIVGVAALFSGYSRPLAVATTRFVLFLLMALNVATNLHHPAALLLPLAAGALWTAGLHLLLARLLPVAPKPPEAPHRGITHAQRWRHWRNTLAQPAGWQYTLRLVGALCCAALLGHLWPGHHGGWIAMTVALLTQRQPEPFAPKSTQRVLGTILGVGLAAVLVGQPLPWWGVTLGAAVLAGARAMLRLRNYLAYSVVMTPLILMIMGAGMEGHAMALSDRVLATLAGAVLVLLWDLAVGPILRVRTAS